VQGAATVSNADLSQQRDVVDAFLAALRGGDFEGLLAVLDPDVVVRVVEAAACRGAPREVRGVGTWATGALAFSKVARFVQPTLVNGAVGLVWAPRGRLFRVLSFTIACGKIDVIADPLRLRTLDLAVLNH
jgi:RNA polymerase sigma-70 factor (ECF subfamily)